MEAWWAALGGIGGLVFLELLKNAIVRGRDEAVKKAAEQQYQAQKLANCLERNEALIAERDAWKEKYFALLGKRK